jgi:hypothetical protein
MNRWNGWAVLAGEEAMAAVIRIGSALSSLSDTVTGAVGIRMAASCKRRWAEPGVRAPNRPQAWQHAPQNRRRLRRTQPESAGLFHGANCGDHVVQVRAAHGLRLHLSEALRDRRLEVGIAFPLDGRVAHGLYSHRLRHASGRSAGRSVAVLALRGKNGVAGGNIRGPGSRGDQTGCSTN